MDRMLVFFDGSTVTVEQGIIEEAKKYGRDTIKVGDSFYKLSAISKNMSVNDYFEQYPEKRPERRDTFSPEDLPRYKSAEEQAAGNKLRMTGLVRGMEKFIGEAEARGENPINAKAVLDRWRRGIKSETVDRTASYWTKIYEKYKDKKNLNESERAYLRHAEAKLKEMNVFV